MPGRIAACSSRAALETAFVHLRPGGAAVFAPDFVREAFSAGTDHGGNDGLDGRALRYLEWRTDPDPDDTTYVTDYAVLLRHADGSVEVRHDRHVEGLFPRHRWLDLLTDVGFQARDLDFQGSDVDDPWGRVQSASVRPEGLYAGGTLEGLPTRPRAGSWPLGRAGRGGAP